MTTAFWEPENTYFWKPGFKVEVFKKTSPLASLCKLQQCKFVKTVMSYRCILWRYVRRCAVSFQSDIANYWLDKNNIVVLCYVLQRPLWQLRECIMHLYCIFVIFESKFKYLAIPLKHVFVLRTEETASPARVRRFVTNTCNASINHVYVVA